MFLSHPPRVATSFAPPSPPACAPVWPYPRGVLGLQWPSFVPRVRTLFAGGAPTLPEAFPPLFHPHFARARSSYQFICAYYVFAAFKSSSQLSLTSSPSAPRHLFAFFALFLPPHPGRRFVSFPCWQAATSILSWHFVCSAWLTSMLALCFLLVQPALSHASSAGATCHALPRIV